MELPAYRVVIMPYGVHERLRSHRGVDLTGKLRDLALAYYQYKAIAKKCQDNSVFMTKNGTPKIIGTFLIGH